MIRNGCLGYELENNRKELSINNKVLSNSFRLFNTCKCGRETELNDNMFTDDCDCEYVGMTGWQYICPCRRLNAIWEGSFDSAIESFYDNDLVLEVETE